MIVCLQWTFALSSGCAQSDNERDYAYRARPSVQPMTCSLCSESRTLLTRRHQALKYGRLIWLQAASSPAPWPKPKTAPAMAGCV